MGRSAFRWEVYLTQAISSGADIDYSMYKTILLLAASPVEYARLRLDEEAREIEEGLRRSEHRDQFKLKKQGAVRTDDLRRALLYTKPQIVHFCGHGTGEDGLVFENQQGRTQLVSTDALADLFKLFTGQIECVVFNSCYSQVQAKAICQHVGCTIGMNKAIGDKAAIKFSIGFYDALGSGCSVTKAYEFGRNAIQLEGIPQHLTPVLETNPAWKIVKQCNIPNSNSLTSAGLFDNRFSLIKYLNDLSPQQLDMLISSLNPPTMIIPPMSATPHGDRTSALLQWAESTTGCGLKKLENIYKKILEGEEENSSEQQKQEQLVGKQTFDKHEYNGNLVTIEVELYQIFESENNIRVNSNISFGMPEINIPKEGVFRKPTSVKFGIKRGKLEMKIQNGSMPLRERQEFVSQNNSWKAETRGTKECPQWDFMVIKNQLEAEDGWGVLHGLHRNQTLGIVELLKANQSCQLKAYFMISINRMYIEIIDLDDGTNKKQKETKIGLLLKYLKSELGNCVSQVHINYDPATIS